MALFTLKAVPYLEQFFACMHMHVCACLSVCTFLGIFLLVALEHWPLSGSADGISWVGLRWHG